MSAVKVRLTSVPLSQAAAPNSFRGEPDRGVRVNCRDCRSGHQCIPAEVPIEELDKLGEQAFFRRSIKRGEHLYRAGQKFHALYAVRSGFFKTMVVLEEGRTQVTGFNMAGDVMGSDGIGSGVQTSEAVALEDSEVCVLTFDRLEQLTRTLPGLQRSLHRLLSREIVREQGVMALLGGMSADSRVAAFLLNLSYRFQARQYSSREFHLRMSREDIGSYLGLKLETVSRTFSRFAEEGLIGVQNKLVKIMDVDRMRVLAGHMPQPVLPPRAAVNVVPLRKAG